jgi:hypothetical protein
MKHALLAAMAALVSAGALAATGSASQAEPPGCTAAATKALVHEFVGDLNTGRLARIDQLWAPAPRFQWYSALPPGGRGGPASKNRATLIPYLRTRVRVHERILITRLVAGYNPIQNTVDFGGKLIRTADDIKPRLVPGPNGLRPIRHDFKGAADCVSRRPLLIVWSM